VDPSRRRDLVLGARPARPAGIGPVIAVVVVALLSFIALSVVLAPAGDIAINFSDERRSITLLSTGMFLMAGCLAAATLWIERRRSGRARLLWTSLTVLMFYFCADEVLQFHEQLGDYLGAHASPGPFRNFNDVIVIGYGLAALPVALLSWREVLRHPRLMTMLMITGALYVGTSAVDSLSEPPTSTSIIVEESIKVFCSTFFMLSMLTGFLAGRWLHPEATPDPDLTDPDLVPAR
jgi:hypothetical protein